MDLKAYKLEDTDGARYYVAAESPSEAMDLVNEDLKRGGIVESAHVQAEENTVKELDINKVRLFDEELNKDITIAEGFLRSWEKGILYCSEW